MKDKSIEELREEIARLQKEASAKNSEARALEKEILTRTSEEVKQYFHKYIKYKYSNSDSYESYLFVTAAEEGYCGDGWTLEGYGFHTYIQETGKRKFDTISPSYGGLHLDDVTEKYYVMEIISKEEFYETRNKILQEIMSETYE